MADRRVFISVQISSHLPGGAVRGREVSAAALTSYTPAALDTTTTTTDSDNASVPFHVRAVAVAASTDESLDPHGP